MTSPLRLPPRKIFIHHVPERAVEPGTHGFWQWPVSKTYLQVIVFKTLCHPMCFRPMMGTDKGWKVFQTCGYATLITRQNHQRE
jgi:hypothetical protein